MELVSPSARVMPALGLGFPALIDLLSMKENDVSSTYDYEGPAWQLRWGRFLTQKSTTTTHMKAPKLETKTFGICLAILALSLFTLRAATDVCGVAMGTWTKAGSPYVLSCNVLVADLQIEPGVTIMARSNCTFEVAGVLKALGTESEPIIFKAVDPTNGWPGIYFNYSSPGSEVRHCTISNAVNSGIRILNSTPYLTNCTITANRGPGMGGGIWADIAEGDLVLRNCNIISNTAASHGGGIRIYARTNRLVMQCCTIAGNVANSGFAAGDYVGGGIYVAGDSALDRCIISENTAYSRAVGSYQDRRSYGGGIYAGEGDTILRNCEFRGNAARTVWFGETSTKRAYGGGFYAAAGTLAAQNCIFAYNALEAHQTRAGAGVYLDSATASFVNCTFAYNTEEGFANNDVGTASLVNCILFFNAAGGTQIAGAKNDVTFSDVQNGFTGQGNINFQPIFQTTNNLMIVQGSRCIDAGNPSTIYNDACFNGQFSLGTARNDMGAHGGPGACCWECGACTEVVIRTQPKDASACVGGEATFGVGATGSQPLSYQWRFQAVKGGNWTDIVGATNASHSISNVQSNHAGYYGVRVTNALGSRDSDPASLVVAPICVQIDLYTGLLMSGGVPGQNYFILSTTNLEQPTIWQTNAAFVQDTGGKLWLDTNAPANKPRKFYMVTP